MKEKPEFSITVEKKSIYIKNNMKKESNHIINDIENIVNDVHQKLNKINGKLVSLNRFTLFYGDSSGCWDIIKTKNNKFQKFIPLRIKLENSEENNYSYIRNSF